MVGFYRHCGFVMIRPNGVGIPLGPRIKRSRGPFFTLCGIEVVGLGMERLLGSGGHVVLVGIMQCYAILGLFPSRRGNGSAIVHITQRLSLSLSLSLSTRRLWYRPILCRSLGRHFPRPNNYSFIRCRCCYTTVYCSPNRIHIVERVFL